MNPQKNRFDQPPRPSSRHHPLYEILYTLWGDYLSEPQWIPVDRWLSTRLRALPKLNQRQKLWLGRQIIDGCRLAICVLFCESVFEHGQAQRGSELSTGLKALADNFAQQHSQPSDCKAALHKMSPADFFFWLRLRGQTHGGFSHEADPLPRPNHHSVQARRFWPDLLRACRSEKSLVVRLLWNGLPPTSEPFISKRCEMNSWPPEQLELFVNRHAQASPIWLRLNHPDQMQIVRQELLAKSFTIHSERGEAMQVSGSGGLFELDTYRQGFFEIQDLASQRIVLAAQLWPGLFVWDACAGNGGKSLQIASLLKDKGAVTASDNNEKKLHRLRLRARHSGLGNSLRILPWDGQSLPEFSKEIILRNGFDRVLVDAPCSGSGTWRRNPDGRLDFDPGRVEQLAALQLRLLCLAAQAVRPGGLLIYATCSILAAENERICEQFLAQNGHFCCQSMSPFGNPEEDSDTTFAAVFLIPKR